MAKKILVPLIDEFLKGIHVHEDERKELSYWQLIFLQSKVNGSSHAGEELPQNIWKWPENTWLQERLSHRRGTKLPRHECGSGCPG